MRLESHNPERRNPEPIELKKEQIGLGSRNRDDFTEINCEIERTKKLGSNLLLEKGPGLYRSGNPSSSVNQDEDSQNRGGISYIEFLNSEYGSPSSSSVNQDEDLQKEEEIHILKF